MSQSSDTKLMLDLRQEQNQENEAMQDIYDMMDEDARERDKYGLMGSISGGLLGFIIGGPQGALKGYQLGGNLAYLAPQEFDESALNDPRLDGGIFNPGAMESFKDDVLYADAAEDIAMYLDTTKDLFTVATVGNNLDDTSGYDYIANKFKAGV